VKGVLFDPYDREQQIEPFALYRHLRDHEPLQRNDERGFWVLSRYEDVLAAFLDPATYSSARGSFPDDDPDRLGHTLGTSDPPRHDRLRKLASAAFSPRRVAEMEPVIRKHASALLEPVMEGDSLEVPTGFAVPLTSGVIASILGVPESDVPMLQGWSHQSFRIDSTGADGTPEQQAALQSLLGYLADAAALRRRNPEAYDDLMADFIRAEVDGDKLDDDEVSWLTQSIFIAGHETTTSSISNGVASLAANPDERRKLREDPGLIPDAFEEMLRLDSPAQGFHRSLTRPVELHGKRMEAGESVIILPGSANRDERVFPDPDRLDVERRPRQHLAFGQGIHYCLGAPLSRLENRIVFEMLIDAFPDWTIDERQSERAFAGRFMLRGYARLRMEFGRQRIGFAAASA
jgi:cytochrome P450